METNKRLSILAMVAVVAIVAVVFFAAKQTASRPLGDITGQAYIRVAQQKVAAPSFQNAGQHVQNAGSSNIQQAQLQMLIQSCLNQQSHPLYEFCRQQALQRLGMSGEGSSNDEAACLNCCYRVTNDQLECANSAGDDQNARQACGTAASRGRQNCMSGGACTCTGY